jgi:hypothetical protein
VEHQYIDKRIVRAGGQCSCHNEYSENVMYPRINIDQKDYLLTISSDQSPVRTWVGISFHELYLEKEIYQDLVAQGKRGPFLKWGGFASDDKIFAI